MKAVRLRSFHSALRILLVTLAATGFWLLLSPIYGAFLIRATENVVRLTERPAATRLYLSQRRFLFLTHPALGGRGLTYPRPLPHLHFTFILFVALFMAPRGDARRRWRNFAIASLLLAGSQIVTLVLAVKSICALDLGHWSRLHYGAWARNVYALGHHLADLPLKLALPFLLWWGFYGHILIAPLEGGNGLGGRRRAGDS